MYTIWKPRTVAGLGIFPATAYGAAAASGAASGDSGNLLSLVSSLGTDASKVVTDLYAAKNQEATTEAQQNALRLAIMAQRAQNKGSAISAGARTTMIVVAAAAVVGVALLIAKRRRR